MKRRSPQKLRQPISIDLWIFYAVIVSVAAFGGSSRYDLMQVAILQPILWLLLALAVIRLRDLAGFKRLLAIVAIYIVWMVIQLIPLPFDIWSHLPGRGPIARLDLALGIEPARPISLAPARTLNALAYLPAFLAPIIAAINLGQQVTRHICFAIVGLALASSLLGLLQNMTGEFYFYAITSTGRMVGLFANTNHNAVFASLGILIAALSLTLSTDRWMRQASLGSAILIFLLAIVNGSRAGLITLAIAGIIFLFCYVAALEPSSKKKETFKFVSVPILVASATFLLITGAYFMSGRIIALDEISSEEPLADVRFIINPVSWQMLKVYFPFGSGIGSFEAAFRISEPDELLSPNYINMAHNDILQLAIEGGLVNILLWAATFSLAIFATVKAGQKLSAKKAKAFWAVFMGSLAVLLLSSAFDYPLRTPLFQALLAVAMVALVRGSLPPAASAD
ncbi:O-antigen ligase family protein [Qipengyuania sp. GH1]|uniref:O-antigen ligase family protein n=1 Tax=Qipengyuania aestuarii TaxID=2867241 RepID=UPI001C8892E2|nr:O-antigen ligase family protein [Qipengyuania aestuarii]MBX7535471.1 O-antigen ligase family protein [Qipengyuania aestuarii]